MIFNCIVIEDEKHAIELLTEHIEALPNLRLSKVYSQPLLALAEVKMEDHIDIIFLDIEMPGISGLELARRLRAFTRFLVFTTAYQKYAIDAFELEANQFIVKPVTLSKFAVVIDKLVRNPIYV